MSNLLLNFRCPNCESIGYLELIETDVIVSSRIESIKKDWTDINGDTVYEIDYHKTEITDGTTDRYQCARCAWILPNITSETELIDYLKAL